VLAVGYDGVRGEMTMTSTEFKGGIWIWLFFLPQDHTVTYTSMFHRPRRKYCTHRLRSVPVADVVNAGLENTGLKMTDEYSWAGKRMITILIRYFSVLYFLSVEFCLSNFPRVHFRRYF